MMCWCQKCRLWVSSHHIEIEDRTNARDGIRYHPGSPLCGDVWKLANGLYVVIDYIDPFCTGFTLSDGTQLGQKYTEGMRQYFESNKGELISTFEELPFPWSDHRGWSTNVKPPYPTAKDSLDFLTAVLKRQARS